jgi:ribosome-binding factor A
MKSPVVKRSDRVASEMYEELAMAVGGLSDPRVHGVRVTRVELTDDLRFARVFVRLEVDGDDPVARKKLLQGLASAGGKLRGEVTRTLSLRFAPELRFLYDEGLEASARVEEILREIAEGNPGDPKR